MSIRLDDRATKYFNDLLADVEWQNGLTPSQRDIGLSFAQTWILDAMINEHDVARAYANVREALRRLANVTRAEDTFVFTRGSHSVVAEKIQ